MHFLEFLVTGNVVGVDAQLLGMAGTGLNVVSE